MESVASFCLFFAFFCLKQNCFLSDFSIWCRLPVWVIRNNRAIINLLAYNIFTLLYASTPALFSLVKYFPCLNLYPIISGNENRIYSGIYAIHTMILFQSTARFFFLKKGCTEYISEFLGIATYCWLASYEYLSVNVL